MSFVLVSIDNVTTGLVVAKNIYSIHDQLLIGEGTTLNEKNIIRLRLYGISEIPIYRQEDEYEETAEKLDNSRKEEKQNIKEKDSREKDSREKDSRDKDSREKDSREKDSKEKDSKEKDSREKDSREKDSKEKHSKEKHSSKKDSKEIHSKERDSKEIHNNKIISKEKDNEEKDSNEKDIVKGNINYLNSNINQNGINSNVFKDIREIKDRKNSNENKNTIGKNGSNYKEDQFKRKLSKLKSSPINESEYFTRVHNTVEFKRFKENFEHSLEYMKDSFNNIIEKSHIIDTKVLLTEFNRIVENSRNGIHVLDMLNCMRIYDDSTYVHSLNVALISNVIGVWLNLSQSDIHTLSLCGMLHDIGKLSIPQELIQKPDKLTNDEYNTVKEHTVLGFNILCKNQVDPRIKLAALMHHEKYDGSGYPSGLAGDQIDFFSKIVAIADVYDAMTSRRVYRGPICPFHVISIFESEGLHMFDPYCLLTFLKRMVQSYLNNWVLLSNKEEAEIILINNNALSKPVVRTRKGTFLDLSREPDIIIEEII